MHIIRTIESELKSYLFKGKVLIVYGARQTGKTTAISHLLEGLSNDLIRFNGDEVPVRQILADCPCEELRRLMNGKKILFIDEAQRIPGIGLTLKRAVDAYKDIQIIVTGSSSLELASKTEEPLTGRKYVWQLPPLSFKEIADSTNILKECQCLPSRLVYGSYPEIVTTLDSVEKCLATLAESYLFRDILSSQSLRRPDLLENLLRALSFQCGSQVSNNEIADLIRTDDKTVGRYIELLKKCFIVFELPSYSRNLRNELKKSKKIYFCDNGIRNAIIGDYRHLSARNDVGVLWENYLMAERYKWRLANAPYTRAYFWRTNDQQEIDLIEESAEGLSAFEFKWNENKKAKKPSAFASAYPTAMWDVIHPKNYDRFLWF